MAKYVDNRDFLNLMIMYQTEKSPKVANKIGRIFIKISDNLIRKPCFCNYTQDRKNEMASDAIFYMWKYMHNYNTDFDNPFAYFTNICFRAFIQSINKCRKAADVFIPIHFIENIDGFKADGIEVNLKKEKEEIELESVQIEQKKLESCFEW